MHTIIGHIIVYSIQHNVLSRLSSKILSRRIPPIPTAIQISIWISYMCETNPGGIMLGIKSTANEKKSLVTYLVHFTVVNSLTPDRPGGDYKKLLNLNFDSLSAVLRFRYNESHVTVLMTSPSENE